MRVILITPETCNLADNQSESDQTATICHWENTRCLQRLNYNDPRLSLEWEPGPIIRSLVNTPGLPRVMINVRAGYTDRYNWTCNWITHKLTTNYTITTMPLSLPATANPRLPPSLTNTGAITTQHYRQRHPHTEYSPHRSRFQWAVSEEKKSRYYLQLLGVLSIIAPIRRY